MTHIVRVVRKVLITLGILILGLIVIVAILIFFGREISLFADRFATIEIGSTPVKSIAYEGSGTGGWLTIDDVHLGLDDKDPSIALNIGSTKENQVAVASAGKVFAFGPPISTTENGGDSLAVARQPGDEAFLITRHSALSWPTPFDFNLMTGHSPSWKRHVYYELRWKKPSGATLDMLWRYEQSFYGKELSTGNGWNSGFGVREASTGLVRVDIKQ